MNTQKHKENLDKILKNTKFTSKTKALWAYYRGNESVNTFKKAARGDTTVSLVLLNLHLNGALEQRLFNYSDGCPSNRKTTMRGVISGIKETTLNQWDRAIKLIDKAVG